MHAIGIDLGTTNSLIAVLDDSGPRLCPNPHDEYLTPSVVSLIDGELEVGKVAKERLVSHPMQSVALFKRTMGTAQTYKLGRQSFRSEELSALVLRSLKKDAEKTLGAPIHEVVVSVPAYFGEIQRQAVKTACKLAELKPLRLINEPTAAALSYGLHEREEDSTYLVYDLGGGTFDVSIVEHFEGIMKVRASAGDAYIGGDDFSMALARIMQHEVVSRRPSDKIGPAEESILQDLAERAKVRLSRSTHTTIRANVQQLDYEREISREEFESINHANIQRLRRPVEVAMYDAKIDREELDRVVTVGGATRMPLIRTLIAKQLGHFPVSDQNPDHVVALGAAVQAGLIQKNKGLGDMVLTDVSAFTLGVDGAREVDGRVEVGYFFPIIERNSTVPISREETFQTMKKGQREITMGIFQGESPFAASNVQLGELNIRVPRNKRENESVAVRFSYDSSGLLEVECRSLSTGEKVSTVVQCSEGVMEPAEIAQRLAALQKLKVHPRDLEPTKLLIARLEKNFALARAGDRSQIGELLARYRSEIERQDLAAIEAMGAEISSFLDEFESEYFQ